MENINDVIKTLEQNVLNAERLGEDMDNMSWYDQVGCLISFNEAKAIIEQIKLIKATN